MKQRRSRAEERKGEKRRRGEEQTDKIREPLTEVREKTTKQIILAKGPPLYFWATVLYQLSEAYGRLPMGANVSVLICKITDILKAKLW